MQSLFSCQRCGEQNQIGDRACKKCGMAFQYFCPQCRSPVSGGDAVCGRCGNTLDWPLAERTEKTGSTVGGAKKNKRGSWVVPIIIILVVLLVAVTGYYIYLTLTQPQNLVKPTENLTSYDKKTGVSATDTAPPIISDIRVNKISDNTVEISWMTNELSTSQVIWNAKNSSPNTTRQKEALVNEHVVELTELNNKTIYYFKVRSVDQAGNEALSGQHTIEMDNKTGIASVAVSKHSMSIEEKPPISGVRTYVRGEIINNGEISLNIENVIVTVTITIPGSAGQSEIAATLDPYPYEINPRETHKFYAVLPNNANPNYTVSARVLK